MVKNKFSADELIKFALEGIENLKGQEVTLLDLRDVDGAVCDYFLICNGTSNTHVKAIVSSIQKTVSKALREKPWHIEGADNGFWVLMDYVDVVVHVFQKQYREYYDIEGLWGDAKVIALEEN